MVAVSGVYLLHFIRKPKVIAHSRKHSSYISYSSLISERNWFSSRAERYHPWLHLQIGLSDAGMQCTQAASSSCSLTVDCEDAYGKPYWPLVPCQQHFCICLVGTMMRHSSLLLRVNDGHSDPWPHSARPPCLACLVMRHLPRLRFCPRAATFQWLSTDHGSLATRKMAHREIWTG